MQSVLVVFVIIFAINVALGSSLFQEIPQVIKHLHRHEVKIFHENDGGSAGALSPEILLEKTNQQHNRDGIMLGIPHVGVFGSVNDGNFRNSHLGDFRNGPGLTYGSLEYPSTVTQILDVIGSDNSGVYGPAVRYNFPNTKGQFVENQLNSSPAYNIKSDLLGSKFIGTLEDERQRDPLPEIIGFVDDIGGIDDSYGKNFNKFRKFGLTQSQIVGVVEDEHIHGHFGRHG